MRNSRMTMLAWLVLSCAALNACAGGSGSSGFDISAGLENQAIVDALDTGQCVEFEGLTICPEAEGADGIPTASPTPPPRTPTPPPTATPTTGTQENTPGVAGTPTANPSRTPTPSPSRPPMPTATPTFVAVPSVDILPTETDSAFCLQPETGAPCSFVLSFVAVGFDPATSFHIAVRTLDPAGGEPAGPWSIGDAATPAAVAGPPAFDGGVSVETADSESPASVQFAVLVFTDPPASVPSQTETLGETGANFAFVTGAVPVF